MGLSNGGSNTPDMVGRRHVAGASGCIVYGRRRRIGNDHTICARAKVVAPSRLGMMDLPSSIQKFLSKHSGKAPQPEKMPIEFRRMVLAVFLPAPATF
jgi:hypothetical protein